MNQLLPIIRRKRRPLLPVEPASDMPSAPQIVTVTKQTEATQSGEATGVVTAAAKPESGDEDVS